jgi:hypothetical protein
MPIPVRTVESKTIVGSQLIGVRQRLDPSKQVTGVAPTETGPPVLYPLDGAIYDNGLYQYSDIQPSCLIGDPAAVNSQIAVKAKEVAVDALKVPIVLEEAAVASAVVIGNVIYLRYISGTTTYANLNTLMNANATITGSFVVSLPGSGAGLVDAQDPLAFTEPTPAESVLDTAGLFKFAGMNFTFILTSIALNCGVAANPSTADAYIQDIGGGNKMQILSAVSGDNIMHDIGIPFMPSQEIIVSESVSGIPAGGADKYVTLYLVKANIVWP